jgi:predicted alpha/beta-hydrolase family hydrolase
MAIEGATWRIRDGNDETIATWDPPEKEAGLLFSVFICAHGAGGHMDDRSILAVTSALRARGIGTVRFNFFYRARKSGRPDSMPRLTACWTAVIARVREALEPERLIIGGRSMGGRAASVVVADGASCDGLLLLAYPLHPPRQPQKLRVAHLPAIHVPVLCINGTRDPFCEPQLMEKTLEGLGPNWRMHWLAGADHSFHVLRSTGRTDHDVLSEVAGEVTTWLPR